MSEDLCLRCGECCKLPTGEDCMFLKRLDNGLTECTIYENRANTIIAPNQICAPSILDSRVNGHADNCPYFRDDKI